MTEFENRHYTADDIQVLEGLEAVRVRPAMYIGSTSLKGLHHLVYEVVDNSIDEALAGICDTIEITIGKDLTVEVKDNGSGIPVEIHPKTGKSTVETVLTMLHAGGKFDSSAYKVSGGLHGVGVSCVNALSERLIVEVKRNGKLYRQEFSKGRPVSELEIVGDSVGHGTKISYLADDTIFETLNYDADVLRSRFREMAFLNKSIKIIFTDERVDKTEVFHYDGGIKSFVEYINRNKTGQKSEVIYFEGKDEGKEIEVAIQYTDSYSENIYSFANNINTVDGGTHLSGFKSALTRCLNDYGRKFNLIKENEENLSGDDAREGLTAIISVKLVDPQFEGQTKTKLGNQDMRSFADSTTYEMLYAYLEEHPKEAKDILDAAILSQRARFAARKARDLTKRKSALETSTLPGKLVDCRRHGTEGTEIFLVEGDSAGGSAIGARDSEYQAILPLRGKIMNVEKARIDKVLGYEEIRSMITAFGTGIGDDFDISKLRYEKIIIMTDADVDGEHIATLLLTFFFRYMKDLIKAGHVYMANPPLYKLSRAKKEHYFYDTESYDRFMAENSDVKWDVQRYKGLGEMDKDQLWETTMDPVTRILKRVVLEDEVEADEIFTMLMGEKVEPRREFIEENARYATNIDT
ncbi:MAG: DNA topoisomerase (ATP-hydrolyzing) subunit B [Tissierellia bacterium]|nr:DNA topoisomerase (ATP-hydrolyzing) subunit B [Tissierellia bacterium]